MKKLVIFDLDGTLLDSLEDLAVSTNHALAECGFPQHETDKYRYMVGDGIMKLFERALPGDCRTAENISRIRDVFVPYYGKHNADATKPYPGIMELLHKLQEDGIKLAVASNKYHEATQKLVRKYFPDIKFTAVFGFRDGIKPKPDPAIVREVIASSGVYKSETLYVGDSAVDMRTAKKAGVTAVGVTWGFRTREELAAESPEYIIDDPKEILKLTNPGL